MSSIPGLTWFQSCLKDFSEASHQKCRLPGLVGAARERPTGWHPGEAGGLALLRGRQRFGTDESSEKLQLRTKLRRATEFPFPGGTEHLETPNLQSAVEELDLADPAQFPPESERLTEGSTRIRG